MSFNWFQSWIWFKWNWWKWSAILKTWWSKDFNMSLPFSTEMWFILESGNPTLHPTKSCNRIRLTFADQRSPGFQRLPRCLVRSTTTCCIFSFLAPSKCCSTLVDTTELLMSVFDSAIERDLYCAQFRGDSISFLASSEEDLTVIMTIFTWLGRTPIAPPWLWQRPFCRLHWIRRSVTVFKSPHVEPYPERLNLSSFSPIEVFLSFGPTAQFRPWPSPWNFPFHFSY
jgi:hypothetical protein